MKIVDLFAGCGGLSYGFQNAGFEIAAAFEFWDIAVNCYKQNFSHPVYQMDLSNTDEASEIINKIKPDIIIGGPPCQDFSHAGKRIEASRASLTKSYADIINIVRPKYFVMENVDRAEKSNTFAAARAIFKNAGYGLTQMVLDASRCGVPQKRKRFFCIGALNENDDFAKDDLLKNVSEHSTTLREYFGNSLDFEYYYRHPRNYSRRAIFSIDEPAPTMRGVNRPVPKGYTGHPNDACELNENVRALTTLERALIQTFPPTYKWCGNKTDMEQMIGNAVPVKLAEFVASALKSYINNNINNNGEKTDINRNSFIEWLISVHNFSKRAASDTVSRVNRADKIYTMPSIPDSLYLYKLQQSEKFNELSSSVRSQIKRATVLYTDYLSTNSAISR